ncbi:MAG: PDZ domain-containing protein [Candidatus Eiseniibacteriota bacterium]
MGTTRSLLATAGPLALLLAAGEAYSDKPLPHHVFASYSAVRWPPGTEILRFENVQGIILLRGTLTGHLEADTTGPLALDTGAGYLALDLGLARILGLSDSAVTTDAVDFAHLPLPRLTLGAWVIDALDPVLTVDGDIVRRVSDRPVLGLLGQRPLGDRAVWIDYREQIVAMIPAGAGDPGDDLVPAEATREKPRDQAARDSSLARSKTLLSAVLSTRARSVPFRLVGDGKILVRGAVSDPVPPDYSPDLNLLVDTGATKCVLFEDAIQAAVPHAGRWRMLRGLVAPTLIGTAAARIALVPSIEVEAAQGRLRADGVDVGLIRSELSRVLSRVTHETIHGLIGYSFLKRFRVVVDYPNRVLWLDPIPNYRDDRPLEYCHVGLQLERRRGAVVVMGVVEGSPAAGAGIALGDEVVALDGTRAQGLDLVALTRRMEGRPGRRLTLVIRRNAVERTVRLVRRRLL